MPTMQYAKVNPQIRINLMNPSSTATDLNGNTGIQTVGEGAEAIVAAALIDADDPTDTFPTANGTIPW
ncbi:hypothetical protein ACGF12_28925 [Kitasatospora sp. NPDC048296]|uniref:hypothetical protein n=1 Tax=Kitasatospora sp. NPDC048296 TaxID=3364048 RepID=UPI0037213E85